MLNAFRSLLFLFLFKVVWSALLWARLWFQHNFLHQVRKSILHYQYRNYISGTNIGTFLALSSTSTSPLSETASSLSSSMLGSILANSCWCLNGVKLALGDRELYFLSGSIFENCNLSENVQFCKFSTWLIFHLNGSNP